MTPEATLAISVFVTALTQILKWSGVPDKYGPIAVLFLSFGTVGLWGWDQNMVAQGNVFNLASAAVLTAVGSAGIFGFTRASAGAVTSLAKPPAGGGAEVTTVTPTENAGERKTYPVRCENCLQVIQKTEQEPVQGATMVGVDWLQECPECGSPLLRPTVKLKNWLADRKS